MKPVSFLRCLDWDGWYGGSIFASVCSEVDVIEFGTPYGRTGGQRAAYLFSDIC